MDDFGHGFHGGDFNGNGSFDPGDYEIYKEIEKGNSSGGHKKNSGNSGMGWIIFFIVAAIAEAALGGLGVILVLIGLYFWWMIS